MRGSLLLEAKEGSPFRNLSRRCGSLPLKKAA